MNSFPEIIVKDVKVIDFDDVDYTDDTYYSTYHKLKSYNKKKNYKYTRTWLNQHWKEIFSELDPSWPFDYDSDKSPAFVSESLNEKIKNKKFFKNKEVLEYYRKEPEPDRLSEEMKQIQEKKEIFHQVLENSKKIDKLAKNEKGTKETSKLCSSI